MDEGTRSKKSKAKKSQARPQEPKPVEPVHPDEAVERLIKIFRDPATPDYAQCLAASGIVNYALAREIAGLVYMLTTAKLNEVQQEEKKE